MLLVPKFYLIVSINILNLLFTSNYLNNALASLNFLKHNKQTRFFYKYNISINKVWFDNTFVTTLFFHIKKFTRCFK